MHEALDSITLKLGMVAHAWNPSPWEVEAGGSEFQDHPWLYGKFRTLLQSTEMNQSWCQIKDSNKISNGKDLLKEDQLILQADRNLSFHTVSHKVELGLPLQTLLPISHTLPPP